MHVNLHADKDASVKAVHVFTALKSRDTVHPPS